VNQSRDLIFFAIMRSQRPEGVFEDSQRSHFG
jgi:hypothetical protein